MRGEEAGKEGEREGGRKTNHCISNCVKTERGAEILRDLVLIEVDLCAGLGKTKRRGGYAGAGGGRGKRTKASIITCVLSLRAS